LILKADILQGVSGGGPYALACAKALPPEKLQAVTIMCGLGPLDIDTSAKGLVARLGIGIIAYPLIPTGVRFMFQSSPFGRVDLSDEARFEMLLQQVAASKPKNAAEKIELESMKDHEGTLKALRSCREAFSRGFYYTGFDGQLMAGRYGFQIEEIRQDLPFQLWYGTLDATTPINHGRQIAARLGNRAQFRESEDTHGSLQVKYKRKAWEGLLNAA
jgi:pimeloyl-ACP methyl ester carboxylesterase